MNDKRGFVVLPRRKHGGANEPCGMHVTVGEDSSVSYTPVFDTEKGAIRYAGMRTMETGVIHEAVAVTIRETPSVR